MKFYSLYVTDKCNMKCSYCYRKIYENEDYSGGTLIHAVNEIMNNEANNDDIIRIEFLGGEPLLEIEKIFIICRYITRRFPEKKVQFMLTTNGTVISDRIIEVLKMFKISVVISVDGLENIHNRHRKFKNNKDTYDTVYYNYDKYFANLNSMIHMTITSDTVSVMYESFKNIHEEFACNKISIGVVHKTFNKASYEIFYNEYIKIIDYGIDNNISMPGIRENDYSNTDNNNKNHILDIGEEKTIIGEYDYIIKKLIKYYNKKRRIKNVL